MKHRTPVTYKLHRFAKARLHPYLVPWEQLSKETQEIDVNFVRRIPRILARADFQVVRNARSASADAP